jgi:hypothetical protein
MCGRQQISWAWTSRNPGARSNCAGEAQQQLNRPTGKTTANIPINSEPILSSIGTELSCLRTIKCNLRSTFRPQSSRGSCFVFVVVRCFREDKCSDTRMEGQGLETPLSKKATQAEPKGHEVNCCSRAVLWNCVPLPEHVRRLGASMAFVSRLGEKIKKRPRRSGAEGGSVGAFISRR